MGRPWMGQLGQSSSVRSGVSGRVAPDEVEERTTGGGEGSKVFLFNCECHTFEEVITQLLKAVPGMARPHDRSGRGIPGRRH